MSKGTFPVRKSKLRVRWETASLGAQDRSPPGPTRSVDVRKNNLELFVVTVRRLCHRSRVVRSSDNDRTTKCMPTRKNNHQRSRSLFPRDRNTLLEQLVKKRVKRRRPETARQPGILFSRKGGGTTTSTHKKALQCLRRAGKDILAPATEPNRTTAPR